MHCRKCRWVLFMEDAGEPICISAGPSCLTLALAQCCGGNGGLFLVAIRSVPQQGRGLSDNVLRSALLTSHLQTVRITCAAAQARRPSAQSTQQLLVPQVLMMHLTTGCFLRRFRHGGLEFCRSAYILPEFNRFQPAPIIGSVLGAPISAKHNLEVRCCCITVM